MIYIWLFLSELKFDVNLDGRINTHMILKTKCIQCRYIINDKKSNLCILDNICVKFNFKCKINPIYNFY